MFSVLAILDLNEVDNVLKYAETFGLVPLAGAGGTAEMLSVVSPNWSLPLQMSTR